MNHTALARFESKIACEPNTGCWLWLGALSGPMQYGKFSKGNRDGAMWAHRASYILYVGEIKEGMQIDHLCQTPQCVNPKHLEQVTQVVNLRRGNGICQQRRKARLARLEML